MTMREEVAARAKEVDKIIMPMMPDIIGPQKTIYEVMEYTMSAGGKRIRPLLMWETYKMFGGTSKVIEPFMAAIEMIHTYSGDALLNFAFETAAKAFNYTDHLQDAAKAMQILGQKAGVFGMIGGQVVDIEMEGKPLTMELVEFIDRKKTASLIEASMMIGAALAGAGDGEIQMMKRISRKIGMAFQIQDDILDVIGTEEELGKPVGSDAKNNKTTYVSLTGIENAQAEVKRLCEEAKQQLELFIGEDDFIMDLITYLIDRKN